MINKKSYLVTKEYRITLYENHEDFGDIFSYKDDPNEINNLWYENKGLRFDLMDKLLREMIKNASGWDTMKTTLMQPAVNSCLLLVNNG